MKKILNFYFQVFSIQMDEQIINTHFIYSINLKIEQQIYSIINPPLLFFLYYFIVLNMADYLQLNQNHCVLLFRTIFRIYLIKEYHHNLNLIYILLLQLIIILIHIYIHSLDYILKNKYILPI